jgi:hypothetical protein
MVQEKHIPQKKQWQKKRKCSIIYNIVFPQSVDITFLFVKAFEFRKFWGRKSEVRRFQDGSISEAVVWSSGSTTLAQKRMICCQLVSYLLNEKFGFSTENGVIYVADQLDSLLERYMV